MGYKIGIMNIFFNIIWLILLKHFFDEKHFFFDELIILSRSPVWTKATCFEFGEILIIDW